MSSAYAPQPFSYLTGGSQAPKTGYRKDEGLYGSRADMAKPIPALRHDQPRGVTDWSIDQRLRGVDLNPAERRRATSHDDTESVLSNVRLPRPDVSLYQSQIDGLAFGAKSPTSMAADTPSGHYSNQSPVETTDAGHTDDERPSSSSAITQATGGMFDNFILKGPGIEMSATEAGARRTEDEERPVQRSTRLGQLFDGGPPTDVAPTDRRDSDISESRLPRVENSVDDNSVEELPGPDYPRNNSFIVTTSNRSASFRNGDVKLTQQSSATDTMTSDRSSCLSCCNYSAGGYGRRRLCILVVLAVFVALLMFSAGFVAGWYASQLQHQQSSDSAAGPVGNDTVSTSTSRMSSTVSR